MDQFYFVEGYLADDYFGYQAEAAATITAEVTFSAAVDIASTTGYYIPDYIETGYFQAGAILDAAAVLSITASVTASSTKILTTAVTITTEFTQTVSGQRDRDIDLLAFADAALAAAASRIRGTNVTVSTVFDIACDFVRTRATDSDEDAVFTAIISALRSRDFDLQTQAAFSFVSSLDGVIEAASEITAASTVACTISHIEGADLTAFADSSVSATVSVTKVTGSTLSTVTTVSANVSITRAANAEFAITAETQVLVARLRDTSSNNNVLASVTVDPTRTAAAALTAQSTANTEITAERLRFGTGQLLLESAVTAVDQRLRFGTGQLAAQSSLSAIISHIQGADIVAENFASLAASSTVEYSAFAQISTAVSLAAQLNGQIQVGANLECYFSIFASRYLGDTFRPLNLITEGVNRDNTFVTDIKKFGTHSLKDGVGIGVNSELSGFAIASDTTFIFETYIYKTSDPGTNVFVALQDSTSTTRIFSLTYVNTNALRLTARKTVDVTTTSSTSLLANNEWHHVLALYEAGYFALWANGTRVGLIDLSNVREDNWNGQGSDLRILFNLPNNWYIDETSLHIGTNLGYSTASTTIAVPSAPRVNDPETTRFLYHFDGNGSDDTALLQSFAAALTAQAQQTSTISGPQRVSSAITASTALTCSISHIEGADLTAFTDAAVAATGTRIRFADSAVTTESATNATAEKITDITTAASVVASQTADLQRIRTTTIATDSVSAQLTVVEFIADGIALQASAAELTTDVVRIKQLEADHSTESQLASTADVTRAAGAVITVTVSLDSTAGRIRSASGTTERYYEEGYVADGYFLDQVTTTASLSLTALRVKSTTAQLDTESLLTIDAAGSAIGIIAIVTSFGDIAATVNAVRSANIALTTTATQTVNADKIKLAQAALSTVTGLDTDGTVTVEAVIVTESIAITLTAAVKTSSPNAEFSTTTALAVNADKITDIIEIFAVETSMTVSAVKTANAVSTQTAVVTQTTVALTNREGSAAITAEFTVTAQAQAQKTAEITAASEGGFEMTVSAIRNNEIDMPVMSVLSTTINVIKSLESSLAIDSGMVMTAAVTRSMSAAFTGFAAQVSVVRELRLETLEYRIPSETRLHTVTGETRLARISQETRIYKIRRTR